MKNHKPQRYEIWFEKAKDDIRYAEGNFSLKFYSQVCFLTQQAVEKALKAYLIFRGVPSREIRIHLLPQLIKKCGLFDISFDSFKTQCQILNRYYIPTRYPPDAGPLGEFAQKEAEEALEIANEIISFVEKKISF